MIWFTSDHHFGHENIIKYVNRPFANVLEMDNIMIDRWNSVVAPMDIVYHLGDFTLGNYSTFLGYADKLNGRIRIIPGGHDKRWIIEFVKRNQVELLPSLYINDSLIPPKDKHKICITMCHYPMLSWEQSHYGAPHLHGHTHGTIPVVGESGDLQLPPNQTKGTRIDVGVDTHNFYPYSLDEITSITESRVR